MEKGKRNILAFSLLFLNFDPKRSALTTLRERIFLMEHHTFWWGGCSSPLPVQRSLLILFLWWEPQLFWASLSCFHSYFHDTICLRYFLNISRWNSGHYFLNQVRTIQHTKISKLSVLRARIAICRESKESTSFAIKLIFFFIKNKCAWTQYLLGVITLIFFFSLKRTTYLPVVETEVKHFWNYTYFS